MRFDILTIFPHIFDSYLNESLFKRAREKELISIFVHDLRTYSKNRHKKVDDKPFGGGPGMVMQIEPIWRAVSKLISLEVRKSRSSKQLTNLSTSKLKTRVILFSTRGKVFDAKAARRLAKYDRLIFICGRYEGVDERVAAHVADEEISMGDYVLSGGELPALTVIEAASRFIPGFLGDYESLEERKGFYPVYSRPADFTPGKSKRSWSVPKVLLSGDHKKIKEWRRELGKK